MARLDQRAAGLLAIVLGLVALIGFGQGLTQALKAPRPEQVAAGVDPSRDPVPNASALGGGAMDEARVRQIAREEATAALGAPHKKPVPAPKAEEDSSDDDGPARTAAPADAAPTAPSAPAPPAAPPAAPPPG